MDRPKDILNHLQRIHASFRGDHKNPFPLLYQKIANFKPGTQVLVEPTSRAVEELNDHQSNEGSSLVESALNAYIDQYGSPPYYSSQQTPQQLCRSNSLGNLSSISHSRSLFEQLQNFNESFNQGEQSDALDQLFSSREWDPATELC